MYDPRNWSCKSELGLTNNRTVLLNIHRHESATKAFRSGVTEVAFFTFPSRPQQEMKVAINEGSVDSMKEVETIGHATGSTIGWGT
jgi:DNA uptake protein ComE-like DNA-binding protein